MTRDQFIAVLNSTYFSQVFNNNFDCFEALFTNSRNKSDAILTRYQRAKLKIASYLALWDAAPDQAAKDAIVGSVDGILGNDPVNPADARNWPPTDGVWGNIYNASPVQDGGAVQWDGTTGQLIKQGDPIVNLLRFNALIDGKTIGNTPIFTTPAGKRFIPTSCNIRLVTVSGLTLVSTISIGTNPPNYNNILGATLLTELSSVNQVITNVLSGAYSSIAPSTTVYCRVSIPSTATTYNLMASIVGYYIEE
ncbi:MAG TPA: hypothetical protein VKZ95_01360 [Sphingobacteriaceae bacterium]|nr:hypothetical protein [Sphingobacteriaceae bacterium]